MSISLLKIVSGETVVCKLLREEDEHYLIQDPCVFVLAQDRSGRAVPVPTIWIPGLMEKAIVKVRKSAVLAEPIPQENIDPGLVKLYVKATSGLDIPDVNDTQKLKLVRK